MTNEPTVNAGKPMICTFRQLMAATWLLHMGERRYVDNLMDIWKLGAPTPNSIIRDPKNYDPRRASVGNYEARIVFPTALAKWIADVANERGIKLDLSQAYNVAMGREDYELPETMQIQVTKR